MQRNEGALGNQVARHRARRAPDLTEDLCWRRRFGTKPIRKRCLRALGV